MSRPWCSWFLLFALAVPLVAQTSSSAKPVTSKADYSQEAFVIEQFSEKEKFENDGTSSREETAHVRVQSDAGVQRYGLVSFSYASGTGTFQIDYVRVRKPDGSVVETPPENVQDMAAEITRQAPIYSDLHEKHVAVKGLSVGDVLEYRIAEHTTKPLAPGQFWTEYRFAREVIVLDEQLEISVPGSRTVKVKSTAFPPAVTEVGGYRVYTWHHPNLKVEKDENTDKRKATELLWQQARGRLPQPDVLVSSFSSWEDVGRWYGGLQDERVKPAPEVAAKAAELTKGLTTDDAKLRALYSYVSLQFRYIGVSFGIGRYQPHGAVEVLANQYGDCKDKHTLLASLLAAAGIPAYPALINSSLEVDPDVPSPGQFDHVITVVPRENGLVWLDTTSEVGPYQFLASPLRDKRALAVWKDKPAALVNTPADLPYPSVQAFRMDAKLSDADVLVGQVEFSSRGDVEYGLRIGFRQVPLPQWKDLVQRISLGSGFAGEVSEVTASSPEKTDEPFRFSYKYTRKDFGDWPTRRIVAPTPFISLAAPSDEELLPLGPIWLGAVSEVEFHSRVELPSGYRPELPVAIHLKKDFAQYDSTHEFKDGALISERHLKTLLREVPASEREDYKQFAKAVQDDYGTFIPLVTALGASASANTGENRNMATMNSLRGLPDSSDPEASRLETQAREELKKHDLSSAISSLYRAVSADPKFTRGWVLLGGVLLTQKQFDAGMDAFHKAMALDPTQSAIPMALGLTLMSELRFEDAVPVWQDYVKRFPEDAQGAASLAWCLLQLKRYPEAISVYEAATKAHSDRVDLQNGLALTYLRAGEREKAGAAYRKIGDMKPAPGVLNDTAYEMAKADLELPLALDYARKAVREAEEESQKITLPDLKMEDVRKVFKVAAYWDTLGWVDERMSNLDEAEQYLRASWKLTQDGVVAGHLCHLYKREHKNEQAVQMCRIAIYRIPMRNGLPPDEASTEVAAAQENLDHLTAGSAKSNGVGDATDTVIHERTFKLGRFLPGTESAEFFVLLSSDGKSKNFKVEDTRFISGSDKMKLAGKELKTVELSFPVPGGAVTRFVRRGILGCYEYSGCSFVLLDPTSVTSLN